MTHWLSQALYSAIRAANKSPLDFVTISGYITGNQAAASKSLGQQVPAKGDPHAPQACGGARAVRVEVQAPQKDAGLIRALAETLRGEADKAEALRSTLAKALIHPEVKTAFDVFGSALPDETFAGVFDQPRQREWSKVDL